MKKNFTHRRYNMLITAGILSFANACSACNKDNNQQNNNTFKGEGIKEMLHAATRDKSVLQGENDDLNEKLNTLQQKYQRLVSQTGNNPQVPSAQSGQRIKENPTYTKLQNVAVLKQALNDTDTDATKLGDVSPKIIAVAHEIDSSLLGNKQTQAFLSLADELISSELFQKLSEQEIGFKADTSQKNGGKPYFGTEDYVLVKELKPETFVDCLRLYSLLANIGYQVEGTLDLEIFAPYGSRDIDWIKGMLSALEKVKDDADFVKRVNEINFTGQILLSKDSGGNNLFINGHDSNFTIGNDDVTRELIGMLEPAAVFNHIFSSLYDEIYFIDDIEFDNLNTLKVRFLGVDVTNVDLKGKKELGKFIFGKAKGCVIKNGCFAFTSSKNDKFACVIATWENSLGNEREIIYDKDTIENAKDFLNFVGKDDAFEPAIAAVKRNNFFNIGDLAVPINFDNLERGGHVEFITNVLNSDLVKEGWLKCKEQLWQCRKSHAAKKRRKSHAAKTIYNICVMKDKPYWYEIGSWQDNPNKVTQKNLCLDFFKALAQADGIMGVKAVIDFDDDDKELNVTYKDSKNGKIKLSK